MFEQVTLYDVIYKVAIAAACAALIFGVIIFRRSGYGINAMACLTLVSICTDLILSYTGSEFIGAVVSRSYSFLEFVLISTFFFAHFKSNKIRYLVVAGVVLFPIIVALDAYNHSQKLRDDLVTVCESIILVSYSVTILYMWMKNIEYETITSAPQFWIVSAILIYFGGNIFVFGSSNYAYSISADAFDFVWTIHATMVVLFYLTLAFGFWKARKAYQ